MPPRRPIVLNRTDPSQNLIVLNVNAQAPLKLKATNYSAWWLQLTSLLFGYDLLSFVDDSKSCPPIMITLPNATSPSLNLDHILCLRKDQLLLNTIVGFVPATSVVHLYLCHISCDLDYSQKDICLSFALTDHDPSPESCQSSIR